MKRKKKPPKKASAAPTPLPKDQKKQVAGLLDALHHTTPSDIVAQLPDARLARAMEIKERCAKQLFPLEKRRLIKGRLEESAWLFHQLNEGAQYTGTCLKAAASLDEDISALTPNRFLTAWVDRSMQFYFEKSREAMEAEEADGDDAPSFILTP